MFPRPTCHVATFQVPREFPVWLLFIGLAAMHGCSQQVYDLELKPLQADVERQLTVQRTESTFGEGKRPAPFPPGELQQIADAYAQEPDDAAAATHTFHGRFTGRMPNDVGGHGTHTYWDSPLGSTSAYIERFRGDDDALAQIEQRQAAVDRLTDGLIGWFESELGDDDGWPALRARMDSDLRRDLKNLAIYIWSLALVSDPPYGKHQEFGIRMVQYFAEREYLTPDELPAVVRAASDAFQGDEHRLLQLLRARLAAQLGHPLGSEVTSLAFLRDRAALEQSLKRFLRTTDEYQRLHERRQREREREPAAEPPEETDVVGELLVEAFLRNVLEFGPGHQLNARLVVPVEPYSTNGQWDEQQRVVRWSHSLLGRDDTQRRWPAMAYALWAEPNGAAQRHHFDNVVLDGPQLAMYCIWYRGLTGDEAQQWDRFVSSLEPRDDLSDHIQNSRFHGEPKDEEAANPFRAGRELLVEALNAVEHASSNAAK